MPSDIEVVAYFGTFLLGIIFSILSVTQANEEEKNPLSVFCSILSALVWIGLAFFNLAFLFDTVFLALSWLYFGIASVFIVWSIVLTFIMIRDSARSKPDEALTLR